MITLKRRKAAKCLSLYSISLFLIITESLTPRKRLLPDKSAYLNSLLERCLSLSLFNGGQFCRTCKTKIKTVTLLYMIWPSISRRCLGRFFLSFFLSTPLRICFQWVGWLKATMAGPWGYWGLVVWKWQRKASFAFICLCSFPFLLPKWPKVILWRPHCLTR